jgi:DNA invertase Pin-like site-specific DNA recombinase
MTPQLPCAIYTRKSSEEGLEQQFNSLDAQREACDAFILSQKALGWKPTKTIYDDGGFSGGNIERPALIQLLSVIRAGRIRIVVVYKVDRLTRSLADFAKLVELFDAHDVSFVSVTQQFNTTSSMGRLTLNVLLSFAQFEREVTGERIRDKIAASKRKGMWMGGNPPMGYIPRDRSLVVDDTQAQRIREIFQLYLDIGSVPQLKKEIDRRGWVSPQRMSRRNNLVGGRPFSAGNLRLMLQNPIYRGQIVHKGAIHEGQHQAIIDDQLWHAVRDLLGQTLERHRTRRHATVASLLAGRVFDADGRKFTVDHAVKKTKRYRYYVCARQNDSGELSSADAARIPANELEDVVVDALINLLRDEPRMVEFLGKGRAEEIRQPLAQAIVMAQRLSGNNASDKIEVLHALLERATVHRDHIDLAVQPNGLRASDDAGPANFAMAVISVPVRLRRSGMAMRLMSMRRVRWNRAAQTRNWAC